ncbi:limonene-1,2-epoxide hydrolase family protein [Cryptosporangium aurantiacum]|uniref:Limonene-1,2-epoxide hydrolase n=1 Tax=Cryptosporangium aurantiacum TaxID=134849 RepID=A0A1M7PBA8_9ACTN|nr:limonene-1,2-epoxide hydrolase family protein [Cryptosporangium aurantiacum]SHN14111.1 limonene-1,2-epoxide hydrolase [Cryptosporangium aurantiacum]
MPDEQVQPDADPQGVVVAFLAALERLDLDAALLLVSDDIVYQNVPLRPARGRAAVERTLRQMLRYCTGFEARMHNIAANGPIVLTERTDVLRIGSWEAAFWVCGTFEVRAGRVVLWRDYFDWTTFMAAGVRGAGKALLARLARTARGPAGAPHPRRG